MIASCFFCRCHNTSKYHAKTTCFCGGEDVLFVIAYNTMNYTIALFSSSQGIRAFLPARLSHVAKNGPTRKKQAKNELK
jgi:hypothetical protein